MTVHDEMLPQTLGLGRAKVGIDYRLETCADDWLRRSRAGVTRLEDKKDYLSPEQLKLRLDREVYNINGFPDPHVVSGLYKRAHNPLSGRRPSKRSDE